MVWYCHLFKNFPQFIVIHTVKCFSIVNESEVDFFFNSLAFSMIQQILVFDLWFLSLFYFFFKFYFIFKLYIIVLVLPNIKMNPPQVNQLEHLGLDFLKRKPTP